MPDSESTLVLTTVDVTVPVPFDADVARAIATSTAAQATDPLILDIEVTPPGGSTVGLFSTPVAKLNKPVAVDDTTIKIEFVGNSAVDIEAGEYLQIGDEIVQVTEQSVSGTGKVSGGVQGSSLVDGGTPVYEVGVTRAALGTSAATADAGDDVLPIFALAVGDTETKVRANPATTGAVEIHAGDEVNYTVVSGTAAAGLQVVLELVQR